MKKSIISLLIGFSVASQALADDLYQVYQQALQNDPATLKAKASKDAAYAAIGTSRAALLPQLDLTLNATKYAMDASGSDNYARLGLSQSIYNASYWDRLDRAELVATQADSSYGLAMQDLIVRTVSTYFSVLQAKDDLEFAQAEKRAIERQLEQTQQRFAVGLTAKTDVHEAQALYDNAVASEISAQNAVEIRLEALREITGNYHPAVEVLDTNRFSAGALTPGMVDEWLKMADEKNLQLLTSKIAVDIAKQDIELARDGHLPTVGLSAGVTNSKASIPGEDRSNTASIGLTVSIPLYSGGGTSAQVETAQNNFVVSSEERERIHRSVIRNVRSNFYDVTAAVSRIKALQQAVVSAESALNATEAGFDVGTRTIVDVLNSTRNLYDAKRNLARARYGYITSVLSLKLAAGTLSESDVMDINQGLTKAG
ncbi:outer membrane channel protein TolC [Bowmanella sp. JS7-9]|uniref:Outer membrane channel protein TolC n=1 Tax=Pseudobowmanella zhangzhouensis TaxID=1537679 RepID=A0ABW1XNC4_9ALTE|nr:outer membrane channel protein TolC [Bowmanella sp. JS7-9]TBX20367.1 outer membrane channel protein [Bowmanella sp. JS7-9]